MVSVVVQRRLNWARVLNTKDRKWLHSVLETDTVLRSLYYCRYINCCCTEAICLLVSVLSDFLSLVF